MNFIFEFLMREFMSGGTKRGPQFGPESGNRASHHV